MHQISLSFLLGIICIVSINTAIAASVYDVFDEDTSTWNTTRLMNGITIDMPPGWTIDLPGEVLENETVYFGSGIDGIATVIIGVRPYSDPVLFSRISELDSSVSSILTPYGLILDESRKYSFSSSDNEHYFSYSFNPRGKKSEAGNSVAYVKEEKGCGMVMVLISFSQEETFTQSLPITKEIADSVKICHPGLINPDSDNESDLETHQGGSGQVRDLKIDLTPQVVQGGEEFVLSILGDPGSQYYLWVLGSKDSWPLPPRLKREQEGIMQDDPEGSYLIGAYEYQDGKGRSVKEEVVDDFTSHGTDYYAKVVIPEDGKRSVSFKTDKYLTKKGTFSIRVELNSQENKKSVIGEITVT